MKIGRTAIFIVVLLIVFSFIAFVAWPAKGHEWYDGACCNENDCRPETVTTVGINTVHEVIRRDDGWFVTSSREFIPFGDKRIKISLDTGTHLCLKYTGEVRCLYLPEAGG